MDDGHSTRIQIQDRLTPVPYLTTTKATNKSNETPQDSSNPENNYFPIEYVAFHIFSKYFQRENKC